MIVDTPWSQLTGCVEEVATRQHRFALPLDNGSCNFCNWNACCRAAEARGEFPVLRIACDCYSRFYGMHATDVLRNLRCAVAMSRGIDGAV
jgi:hypothetical protein